MITDRRQAMKTALVAALPVIPVTATITNAEAQQTIRDLQNRLEEFEQALEEGCDDAYQMIVAERNKNKSLEIDLYDKYNKKVAECEQYYKEQYNKKAAECEQSSSSSSNNKEIIPEGVLVIKFASTIGIANTEELFKDVPVIDCYPLIGQKTTAWLPQDRALDLRYANKPFDLRYANKSFYGLVSIERYQNSLNTSSVVLCISPTPQSIEIEIPDKITITTLPAH